MRIWIRFVNDEWRAGVVGESWEARGESERAAIGRLVLLYARELGLEIERYEDA